VDDGPGWPTRWGMDKVACLIRSALASMTNCRRFWQIRWVLMRRLCLRLVTGYSEFVNGGKKIQASLIDRIQDRNGSTICGIGRAQLRWLHPGRLERQQEPLLADDRQQVIDRAPPIRSVSHAGRRDPARHRPVGQGGGKPLAERPGCRIPRASGSSGSSPDLAAGVSWASTPIPAACGRYVNGRG